jgi:DNA modification methylase
MLPDGSVHCVVTSPPYWGLRDYGTGDAQIGLEQTPEEYVAKIVAVFREVRRVLRDDGTLWLNLGDSYAGSGPSGAAYQSETTRRREGERQDGNFTISKTLGTRGLTYAEKKPIPPPGLKPKDLVGIPWMVAFALRQDGWYLRSDIVWAKGSVMPESVKDRPTKSHEYLFLLAKSPRYFYDADAIREESAYAVRAKDTPGTRGNQPSSAVNGRRDSSGGIGYHEAGRNKRTVWAINPRPYRGAHFAVFPPELVEPCILAGTSERGCCPSCGAPWIRCVEKPEKPVDRNEVFPNERDGGMTAEQGWERSGMSHFKYAEWLRENPPSTTGWDPGCSCPEHASVPCVVLDPFSGSGTTGQVALDRGRAYVGVDLNPEYLEMAQARILGERPPVADENDDPSILEFFS